MQILLTTGQWEPRCRKFVIPRPADFGFVIQKHQFILLKGLQIPGLRGPDYRSGPAG